MTELCCRRAVLWRALEAARKAKLVVVNDKVSCCCALTSQRVDHHNMFVHCRLQLLDTLCPTPAVVPPVVAAVTSESACVTPLASVSPQPTVSPSCAGLEHSTPSPSASLSQGSGSCDQHAGSEASADPPAITSSSALQVGLPPSRLGSKRIRSLGSDERGGVDDDVLGAAAVESGSPASKQRTAVPSLWQLTTAHVAGALTQHDVDPHQPEVEDGAVNDENSDERDVKGNPKLAWPAGWSQAVTAALAPK